jgi:outer membrane protein OmpA-like peptidoglycan-associated protein
MTGKGDRDREVMYNGIVADGGQNITLPARIVFMDDLSERQKEIIRIGLNEYGNPVVTFDPYGINASSGTFLDRVVHLMKENPGVGLEIVFHTAGDQPEGKSMEISEIWAQELAFYLKGLEMDMGTAHIKGMGSSYPVFGTVLSDDKNYSGHIEFIFFKN